MQVFWLLWRHRTKNSISKWLKEVEASARSLLHPLCNTSVWWTSYLSGDHCREKERIMGVTILSHVSKSALSNNWGCPEGGKGRIFLFWGTMLSGRTLQWEPSSAVSARDHRRASLQHPGWGFGLIFNVSDEYGSRQIDCLKALLSNTVRTRRKPWLGSLASASVNHHLFLSRQS